MEQQTLKRKYSFEGRGLHTGKYAHMTLCPAPENHGISFFRSDIGKEVRALATNVSRTARSTTLSENDVQVITVEHLLSALTGMGIDNAIIDIDNEEVPILDGSAIQYVKAIQEDGVVKQGVERKYVEITQKIEVVDEETGSWVKIEPAEEMSFEVTVDFNSKVLGIQKASWTEGSDYATQLAPCRTFCFFHEIEALSAHGLIKGGDVNNAIVVVEHPVSDSQLDAMSSLFDQPRLSVKENGYLSNIDLYFPNECGRHKLLDLIGDFRLLGAFPRARISAYKPGHKINSMAAKAVLSKL